MAARYDSPPKVELQRTSVPFKHEKQMLFCTAFFTIVFLINPPYLLIFSGSPYTKVVSVPGIHVRPVNMSKFLNNIPSLGVGGVINCTSDIFMELQKWLDSSGKARARKKADRD